LQGLLGKHFAEAFDLLREFMWFRLLVIAPGYIPAMLRLLCSKEELEQTYEVCLE